MKIILIIFISVIGALTNEEIANNKYQGYYIGLLTTATMAIILELL